jgi:hypothetical protein
MYPTIEKAEIVRIGGRYFGIMKMKGQIGGYYKEGKTRMEVITKLLIHAKLDGFVK